MAKCSFCFSEYNDEIAQGVCPYCGYYKGRRQKDPRYLPIGTLVHGRYTIGGVIGDGGFGITYRVWDNKVQRLAALKEFYQQGVVNRIPGSTDVFITAPSRNEEFCYGRDRLLREAQIVSKFQSPAIVRVDDYFEANGTSYMEMEYLAYPTLTQHLKDHGGPMSPEAFVPLAVQICDALTEIHAAGVLHRDISPDNILIAEDNQVKIIDFGSAWLSREDTFENLIPVKVGFSPVEQYEALDAHSNLQQPFTDIYALGATMYYALTGKRPMESRARKSNLENGLPDMPEPKALNPEIPENLNNTIMRAMAINSHERFRSAQELKRALQGDTRVPTLKAYRHRKRLKRVLTIAAAFILLLAVIVARLYTASVDYDEITLDSADITVWYCTDSSDAWSATYDPDSDDWTALEGTTDQDGEALMDMLDEEAASTQFANVTITVRGIPADAYEATLADAAESGTMPTIFQCTDRSAAYMSSAVDDSSIVSNLDSDSRSCLFLKDERKTFASEKCIPTGFDVPVIYINTSFVTDYTADTKLTSIADLLTLGGGELEFMPIAVGDTAAPLFEATFDDYATEISELDVTDCTAFLNENAAIYLGTAADYAQVQDALIGNFTMALPDSDTIGCTFCDYWSIGSCTAAQQAAAEVLLAYFYTDNAQDALYSRAEVGALPVNQKALNKYCDVYDALAFVTEHVKDYTFTD